MSGFLQNSLASWKTSILGIVLVIVGIVQASKSPSLAEAFTNPQTQIALIAGVAAFLAKDNSVTGTAANPRAQVAGDPTPQPK